MRAEILLLVLALLVTIIGVNTDSTGKTLKYKGIQSVKVGKKTYKCSFNIAYTATACIKKTATVKCRPKTNKLTLKFPQIDADDATLDVTVFKNKIKTCKVASGSTMIPTIPAVTTTLPPQGECPCNGDMQSMRDMIADLMTKFENHETFIKENAAAIAAKCDETTCSAVKTTIANHETEIKENTASITTKCNETTCSAVKTSIANLETEIKENTAAITTKCNETTCSAVKTSIANHETKIKENTATITTKCNETTCNAVKTTIANHETEIKENTAAITTKCNETTCSAVKTTIANHETEIKENSAAITTKCNETTCNTVKMSIANHETEIKENTAAIKTKCNETTCSAVKTTIANHETELASHTDSINKNNAKIETKCEESTCTILKTTASKLETCLGDVSSADCPPSSDGKTGVGAAIQENTEALANKCDAETCTAIQNTLETLLTKTVLVMGPDPWITVSLPDFAPASSNCSIPVLGVSEGYTTHGKTIDGKLYICDQHKCSKYDSDNNTWELQTGMKFETGRVEAYSTWIPGANPQWVVQGGYLASAYDWLDSAEVWTPETRNWKLDPVYKSPQAVWGHCVVALNNKILQIGGAISHGKTTNRVFLGDVEVASMATNRVYHACLLYNEKVWVAAGYNGKGYGSVVIYDDKTNLWTDGPTIPIKSTESIGKLREIEGQLYYLGNQSGKIFKIENDMWKEVASIPKGYRYFAEVVETKC